MRWERLFDDLAAQWAAAQAQERAGEIADRTRRERATVGLLDRLLAHRGELDVVVRGGQRSLGTPVDLGQDFVVLASGPARHLLPLSALVQITGLGRQLGAPSEATAARRFGLGYALRGIARDRAPVLLDDLGGRRLTGTIESVGLDHIDLHEHHLDVPPRRDQITAVRTIPFAALMAVSSA